MSYSMKKGGKEVGSAAKYAPPHDMTGRSGVRMSQPMGTETVGEFRMVVGNTDCCPPAGTKTSGIKMRGGGAATKGIMARGPMG